MGMRNSSIDWHYRHKYNMTLEEYDVLYAEQDGKCAICNGINSNGDRLSVDHNHDTKKIRALLCCRCNTKLGFVERYKNFCEKAVNYLNKHA